MDTEKEGGLQSEPIEEQDVAPEVETEVESTPEPPKEDEVQKWEAFNKLISERESAAKAEAERHFQSIKDKEVAAEKRLRLEAEKAAKLNQAHIEAQRELFLAGLDPESRSEAEKKYNAHVARKQEELNKPTPEMLAEAQAFNEQVLKAKTVLNQLEAEFDIEVDFNNLKCSDPAIDLTDPYKAYSTAKARLRELRNPAKPKETEEVKEAKPTKKAPKVDEGGSRGSTLSDEEFIKAYAKGEKNSPADHKRANKILTGG